MVPQQSHDGNAAPSQSDIATKDEGDIMNVDDQADSTVFGSQQVKETSNTPYTDATQVSANTHRTILNYNSYYFYYLSRCCIDLFIYSKGFLISKQKKNTANDFIICAQLIYFLLAI